MPNCTHDEHPPECATARRRRRLASPWRPWRTAATLLWALLLVNPALAADSADAANTPVDSGAAPDAVKPDAAPDPKDPTTHATQEGAAGEASTEVFVPSEEISEDYTVSFPVDI